VSAGTLTVLGIETSCDETAASVVRGRPGAPGEILSNIVLSQLEEHAPYGGVVPEIAARAHIETLDGLIVRALKTANVRLADLDAIAATAGPGLIGGVIVGLMTAKGLCLASDKPLVAVNHLEGHALSARLTDVCPFPYLLLLVSGGHCQLLAVEAPGRYRLYGTTIDDAVGEAFDKTAMLLGLGHPGGPAIERAAEQGKRTRFRFPRPLLDREGMDFSFSGLKTSVRYLVDEMGDLNETDKLDLAASFQAAVVDSLVERTRRAIARFTSDHGDNGRLVVAGGVAANKAIRSALSDLCRASNMSLVTPPPSLCTDNAAMIAWAGIERFALGQHDDLGVEARARWPLAA
jgi:N6-L-threonylcarbamoyladenine synthase